MNKSKLGEILSQFISSIKMSAINTAAPIFIKLDLLPVAAVGLLILTSSPLKKLFLLESNTADLCACSYNISKLVADVPIKK